MIELMSFQSQIQDHIQRASGLNCILHGFRCDRLYDPYASSRRTKVAAVDKSSPCGLQIFSTPIHTQPEGSINDRLLYLAGDTANTPPKLVPALTSRGRICLTGWYSNKQSTPPTGGQYLDQVRLDNKQPGSYNQNYIYTPGGISQ